MICSIRLFAKFREVLGAEVVAVDLPEPVTVGQLRSRLSDMWPAVSELLAKSAVAVNHEFVDPATVIPPDAEIAIIPPVSGG